MRLHPRARLTGTALGCAVLSLALTAAPAAAGGKQSVQPHWDRVGHAALAPRDGWGAATTGTTGGAAADAAHTSVVTSRAELVAALGGKNSGNGSNATPKIIYVKGTIDLNTDDAGTVLSCADYATDGYNLADYLAAYNQQTWGTDRVPTGPLEDARKASQQKQAAQVQIRVGSNTTLVGIDGKARILGGGLLVKNVDNVIIRNLTFEDAADCFPAWDPTDDATGNWNSEYDSLALATATHVWVDHNTFTDGRNPDSAQPLHLGRPYQVHDGQLDITNGSDYVTASWNVFKDHDKTNLVGSSNSSTVDPGHLRVTFHHNKWDSTIQRAPRVRFGQVDVYNNHYVVDNPGEYEYSWGVGKESQIVAEHNYFTLTRGAKAAQAIHNWGGTAITASGNLVNGVRTDIVGAFNAANPDLALGTDAGWTPTLRAQVTPTALVPAVVGLLSGAGRL
ncbi:pectate lyase family protein [Peterkaempfera bronchialis]|uniref:pectate lyase family protein n=1 Tax=Peterkaempfera bronchialis TaxID=2126346 RepID=UPI003C2C077B